MFRDRHIRKRPVFVLIIPALLYCCVGNFHGDKAWAEEVGSASKSFSDVLQPFVAKNCFSCHGDEKQSGELNLQKLATQQSILSHRDAWEEVLRRIASGEMPPKDRPRPDKTELNDVTTWLALEFETADKLAIPDPGRVTVRRLNRTEYNNTIRDLLGVDLPVADEFPPDNSGYGFDNNGDVLSMSMMQMEKYLKAAEKVARTAVYGVEPLKPVAVIHQPWYIDFDTTRAVKTDYDESGLSMPYSSHAMHRIPVDGEYEITGWLRGFRPNGSDPIRMGYWVDGVMVHEGQVEVPSGGELNGLSSSFKMHLTAGEHWLSVTVLKIYEGLPPAYKGPNPNQNTARASKSPTEFFVQNIRVVGPLSQVSGPTELSRLKIYGADVSGSSFTNIEQVRTIISNLARRAFRRPVSQSEVNSLIQLVELAQKNGDSIEEGICLTIQKILVSPQFLFRIETGKETSEPQPLSAHELASRLSYFLWSTMPDEELSQAADTNSLFQPEVLETQVKRMLRDPKSFALVENFGGQWLQFRALESHTVERKKFQQYTDYTIMSMRKESELFFQYIVREDRSVLDFIDSNYTFLNQRLAEYYGIPDVKGHEFRKVELPEASHRGGVITQAAILTASSYATRTSPVIRGKWVLETLLNAPPPPPPSDIPALDDSNIGTQASLREQLAKHRENATCASCHDRMDPLGFALENYNAVGAWREKDGKFEIDASGDLPDGRSFKGPEELKSILLSDKRAFVECLSDKLVTYALGRGLKRSDRRAIKSIADRAASEEYRFSSLVLGIVNSPQFQMRGALESSLVNITKTENP